MYTAGILPVAQQKFTCSVFTTTPGNPQSYVVRAILMYSASSSYIMQQAKKVDIKGNPLMPCLLLGEPCADCKAKGEYICIHNTEKGPFWKSNEKRTAFGFFYSSDKETDMMENYNALMQNTNYGFLPSYIEGLSRRIRWVDNQRPNLMVLSADACGGGKDEMGITMGYKIGANFIVSELLLHYYYHQLLLPLLPLLLLFLFFVLH